jgi:hypothetical protein
VAPGLLHGLFEAAVELLSVRQARHEVEVGGAFEQAEQRGLLRDVAQAEQVRALAAPVDPRDPHLRGAHATTVGDEIDDDRVAIRDREAELLPRERPGPTGQHPDGGRVGADDHALGVDDEDAVDHVLVDRAQVLVVRQGGITAHVRQPRSHHPGRRRPRTVPKTRRGRATGRGVPTCMPLESTVNSRTSLSCRDPRIFRTTSPAAALRRPRCAGAG